MRFLLAFLLLVGAGCKRRPRQIDHYEHQTLTCAALEGCTSKCADARCAEACVGQLTFAAHREYFQLQKCVVPACANADAGEAPCATPGSFACKMCVLAHCPSQAAACMKN